MSSNQYIPLKTVEEIALHCKAQKLTPREVDVAACVAHARTAKGIASLTNISPRTVEFHIQSLKKKLDAGSRDSLVAAIQNEFENQDFLTAVYNSFIAIQTLDSILGANRGKTEETDFGTLTLKCQSKVLADYIQGNLTRHFKAIAFEYEVIREDETVTIKSSASDQNHEITVVDSQSYEAILFDCLEKLQSNSFRKDIEKQFQDTCSELKASDTLRMPSVQRKYAWIFNPIYVASLAFLIVSITLSSILISKDTVIARHSLTIPREFSVLDRTSILAQMDTVLKDQTGIRTVVLTGIGGSGKTMAARLYAREQDVSINWEINAESQDSIVNSFFRLADILATNDDLKHELGQIRKAKKDNRRQKKLQTFITKRMRQNDGWVLILDNVEKLADLRPFVPEDEKLWGKGTVIITSREPSKHRDPKYVIEIDRLTDQQKLDLFKSIIFQSEKNYDDKELKEFLFLIPSYPLDVSTAAHYLLQSEDTLDGYTQKIRQLSPEFEAFQKSLQNEISQYAHTRFAMVKATLTKLTQKNPLYKDLFKSLADIKKRRFTEADITKEDQKLATDFLKDLHQHGLVFKHANGSYSMHRTIILMIRSALKALSIFS